MGNRARGFFQVPTLGSIKLWLNPAAVAAVLIVGSFAVAVIASFLSMWFYYGPPRSRPAMVILGGIAAIILTAVLASTAHRALMHRARSAIVLFAGAFGFSLFVLGFSLASRSLIPPEQSPTQSPAGFDARVLDGATYGIYPPGAPVPPGQRILKKWRLTNTSSQPWGPEVKWVLTEQGRGGFKVLPQNGLPLGQVVPPGGSIDIEALIVAGNTPGRHAGTWRLADPSGYAFGNPSYLEIDIQPPAAPPSPPLSCLPEADWAGEDEYIAEPARVLPPGKHFYKVWRIRNSGTCPWDERYKLVYFTGSEFGASHSVPLPYTPPNKTIEIIVEMVAPQEPGHYEGVWRLQAPSGKFFGWYHDVVIKVGEPARETQAGR